MFDFVCINTRDIVKYDETVHGETECVVQLDTEF